ncbi:GNAT family N-acetyltransferase [Paenibacillus flagellatus]|uniref:N-acetyltransferase domain-containing protein n=1 Tax=Paenibacillus flagellatus TaxID=2211139 RepID=A0A2V5KW08_9BACL|nr:GNAT family N-acetyltransferase [Paenibacillus flagellatus]PYI56407.1 hypothetical protein DLM86_05365 [Paenibacillus flagellatus]
MELRLYRQEDYEQTRQLEEKALRETGVREGGGSRDERPAVANVDASAEGGECWVGEEDGAVVAVGAFVRTPGNTAEIEMLCVSPDREGRGLGRAMLDKLEERAASLGCLMVHLELPESRTRGRKLFESAGYTVYERRLIDGEDRLLYAKWIAADDVAGEPSEEDEAKFQADWELAQQLIEYAKGMLREGASPERTMEAVLASELYAAWNGEERTFGVGFDEPEQYRDWEDSVRSERYIDRIEGRAAAYFAAADTPEPDADEDAGEAEPVDPVFAGMDIRVTPERLAYEIASFSKAVGLPRPIRYVHFLALFSGATMIGMEPEELDTLIAHKERVAELAESFAAAYGSSPE